jgi:hypothetical protein
MLESAAVLREKAGPRPRVAANLRSILTMDVMLDADLVLRHHRLHGAGALKDDARVAHVENDS